MRVEDLKRVHLVMWQCLNDDAPQIKRVFSTDAKAWKWVRQQPNDGDMYDVVELPFN